MNNVAKIHHSYSGVGWGGVGLGGGWGVGGSIYPHLMKNALSHV